jgi:hypothetical protein
MESIALNKTQLSELYGVCTRTFTKWLIKAGFDHTKRLYTPKDQERMFEVFGVPKDFDKYIISIKLSMVAFPLCII